MRQITAIDNIMKFSEMQFAFEMIRVVSVGGGRKEVWRGLR